MDRVSVHNMIHNPSAVTYEILENDNLDFFRELDAFADEHWGEDGYAMEDPTRDYFDKPKWIVLAKAGGEPLGVIYLFPRKITFEGKEISMVGVGEVVVHRNHRGMGIAKQMLGKAMKFLHQSQFDVAVLATDVNKLGQLYGQFGFVKMSNPYTFIDRSDESREESDGMIAALSNPEILTLVQQSNQYLHVGKSNF